jgi:hypothetical protein
MIHHTGHLHRLVLLDQGYPVSQPEIRMRQCGHLGTDVAAACTRTERSGRGFTAFKQVPVVRRINIECIHPFILIVKYPSSTIGLKDYPGISIAYFNAILISM